MKKKSRAILGVLVLAFATTFFYVWFVSNRLCVPDYFVFDEPLSAVRTIALPDGGSMRIDFIDAGKKHWEIARMGSLDVDPANQKMEVVRWWLGFFPIRCDAPVGSALEERARDSLARWLSGKLTENEKGLLAQGDVKTFKLVSWDVVNIWAFVNWIDLRRAGQKMAPPSSRN